MVEKRDGIHIISTGGTFEKVYDPTCEAMGFLAPSCVPAILSRCSVANCTFHSLLQVDSQTLDRAARLRILDYARSTGGDRFVVVHGTSSMVETARVFADEHESGVYVFTGAMVPFAYSMLEASFNLGGAIAAAGQLQSGVHIFMHGELFDPRHAAKDIERARIVHA